MARVYILATLPFTSIMANNKVHPPHMDNTGMQSMDQKLVGKELQRDQVPLLWTIDRSEIIDFIYRLEGGVLIRQPSHFEVSGWPPGEPEKYTPLLLDCFDRSGWFYGLFDGILLVAVVVLDHRFMGQNPDQLQLSFLHVSHQYRRQGLGQRLFALAAGKARDLGARRLYISATPSEHTIDFYLRLGCTVTLQPDPDLFALEPEDIHLEFVL